MLVKNFSLHFIDFLFHLLLKKNFNWIFQLFLHTKTYNTQSKYCGLLIGYITKPCTYLHPAPSTSTQLHPTHFSLHPALCNTLDVIRTKVSHVIGQFPQTYAEKLKAVHFNWKLAHMVYWRRWYGIQTFKLAQMVSWGCWFLFNPFLGKFKSIFGQIFKIRFIVFLIPFGLFPQSNNLVGF